MPMWDDEPEFGGGTCARCQRPLTRGRVYWITRSSAADARIVLCPDPEDCEAPAPPIGVRRAP